MKKKNFVMLLVAFLSLAGLTACSDDERDNATSIAKTGWYGSYVVTIAFFFMVGLTACSNEDGDWDPMDWKNDVKMEKKHSISVPMEGGTYQFSCKNYSFWFYALQEYGANVELEYDDVHHIHGEWVTADVENDVLTVTISPNDTGKQRAAVVGVTAGDVFDSFTFNQGCQ